MECLSSAQNSFIWSIISEVPNRLRQFCEAISMNLVQLKRVAYKFMEKIGEMLQTPTKIPMHTSKISGAEWVNELLNGHPVRCFNALRTNKGTFLGICHVLEYKYQIDNKAHITNKERLAWFLRTISHKCANRDTMERFQHSRSSTSDHFGDILNACNIMERDLIKPSDPSFQATLTSILYSSKYNPYFKDCVGALDGCYIQLTVPDKDRSRFINRKGFTSTNVLAVCDFDMLFVFVCSGWEGSAHDTRVYMHSIGEPIQRFPHPPVGKHFLGDKGYPYRHGMMTPHTRVRYHQAKFRAENPRGDKEKFNKARFSLRSVNERCFGVLKARWKVLLKVPSYPMRKQIKIVNTCFILHNFIRLSKFRDPAFDIMDSSPYFIPDDDGDVVNDVPARAPVATRDTQTNGSGEMVALKAMITQAMMNDRIGGRV